MRKKVLFLALEKGFGGISKQIITLANSLVSLYDIELLCLSSSSEENSLNPKIKVTIKPKTIFTSSANFHKKLFKNVDAIIATSSYFNKYVTKYAPKAKKILWEHYYPESNCKYLEKYDKIVVPSRELAQLYESVASNVTVISDAIEVKDTSELAKGNNLIFVGKIEKDKRIDDLITVYSGLRVRNKGDLVIVGTGSLLNYYKDYIKEAKYQNIHFVGELSEENLAKEFLNSSIYISCSETDFSNTAILQAMVYGIPVVAFDDVSIFKQFIVDDINGFLIKNRDKELMQKKIKQIMTDTKMHEDMANCAKEKVLEFDINSLKREWLKIL